MRGTRFNGVVGRGRRNAGTICLDVLPPIVLAAPSGPGAGDGGDEVLAFDPAGVTHNPNDSRVQLDAATDTISMPAPGVEADVVVSITGTVTFSAGFTPTVGTLAVYWLELDEDHNPLFAPGLVGLSPDGEFYSEVAEIGSPFEVQNWTLDANTRRHLFRVENQDPTGAITITGGNVCIEWAIVPW